MADAADDDDNQETKSNTTNLKPPPPSSSNNNEAAVLDEWRQKRRRRQQRHGDDDGNAWLGLKDDNNDSNSNSNDNDRSLLTTAKRRKLELEQFLQQRQGSNHNSNNHHHRRRDEDPPTKTTRDEDTVAPDKNTTKDTTTDRNNDNTATTEKPAKDAPATASSNNTTSNHNHHPHNHHNPSVVSLMDQMEELQTLTSEQRQAQQRQHEEEMLLRQAQAQLGKKALQSAKDVASGVVYQTPMPSTWRVPRYLLQQPPPKGDDDDDDEPQTLQQIWQETRQQFFIGAEGKDIPPPLTRFEDMKLPPPILQLLRTKQINKPTPIQMQGIPTALAGRDLVGIAFTGSGKTLAFSIPAVMVALEQELLLPLQPGEGPCAILMAPSRELARQTYEVLTEFLDAISNYDDDDNDNDTENSLGKSNSKKHKNKPPPRLQYPKLNSLLIVGGEPMGAQVRALRETPIHCVVCTAGRVRMLLKEHRMNFDNCRLICLDEADRLLDLGFDEDVGDIFNFFSFQKQTLLFSATFPQKFQDFCRQTLVQPIVVNVGRAGAANLDVIQEVEYVKQEAKLVYLLSALQKTAPPVCIFSQRQKDVDDIHEYLLLKGVQAVSIHGGKDQQDRNAAIDLFKTGQKDVLIATDVAAKGLDFQNIQHVINFDMPTEIENYVHRIGRTGRCGKTGVATTFINNKSCDEMTLLDLKALLKEARQRIPPVLEMLEDPRPTSTADAAGAGGGCSFCGGLGHSIVDCPKIEKDSKRIQRGNYDALQMGGGDW